MTQSDADILRHVIDFISPQYAPALERAIARLSAPPLGSDEVREMLAAYDAAERACMDARTSIEYHEADRVRRDATVRIVDYLRPLS